VTVRVIASSGDTRAGWTAPAARADVTVGDYPQHVAAVPGIEALDPDRYERRAMSHGRDGTPWPRWYGLASAAFLAACIGLVFLIALQVGRVYGLNP